ncbi:MAG: sulfurtransferase complex subunit TusB [Methylococcales bacterium]|nr:sulfurtransferase complex subunit TusB [Methylococcales bacterium]MCK5924572.1 sulfurtransferase complex subunit TusB [Methylococcales bacterium]
MLHLIYQSPLEIATLQRIGDNDSVLFLENSLFQLLKKGCSERLLTENLSSQSLFVLDDEIQLRGIQKDELITTIEVIHYEDFVHLTLENPLIQTWN